MKRSVYSTCLLWLIGLLTAFSAQAANYYVRPSGSNTNNGTSYATAFQTVQQALSTASGASTIYVEAGTYKERLQWTNSGASATGVLTLTNYNGGDVYVDGDAGGTNSAQNALLAIVSKSNLVVSNLSFRNNYRLGAGGIYMEGSGTNVKIINCKLFNIGWTTDPNAIPSAAQNCNPLLVVGKSATAYSEIYLGNNEIRNCITGFSECMTLNGNVTNFLIEGNLVHDNTNIGIDLAGHYSWTGAPAAVNQARSGIVRKNTVYNCVSKAATSAGIYVDGGKWITIENNRVYGNGAGLSVGCEQCGGGLTAEGIVVRNNFIYNNLEAGIYLGSGTAGGRVVSSTVSNNTFYRNFSKGGFGVEIALQNSNLNTISNNILVPRDDDDSAIGVYGYTATNVTIGYNLLWRTSSDKTGNMFGNVSGAQSSVFGDPRVVSATDLHLQAGSAAINAGDPAAMPAADELDIDDQPRRQGGRVDIGADETNFVATSTRAYSNRSTAPDALHHIPNPCTAYIPISQPAHLALLDMTGRVVAQGYFPANSRLDVRALPAGIYILQDQFARTSIRLAIEQ
jgi:Right handed beta helix region